MYRSRRPRDWWVNASPFSLAVSAARLFTMGTSVAISIGMHTLKPIAVQRALLDEIAGRLFLEE